MSVKVLIFGAGAMARKHIDAYRKLSNAEVTVTAVANRNLDRAVALCNEYDIPTHYTDFEEALSAERPDVVSICVPTAQHPSPAIAAMERGAHVLSEKPIALTVEAATDMIRTAEKHKRKLSVVFNRRFNSVWHELRRRLPAVGSPIVYNTQEVRSIRPKLPMHSRSGNGGPVIDCCVHDFDMLLQLFGPARSVFATGTVFGSNKPFLSSIDDFAVDTAHIDVEFENGHRGYLLYAWGFPEGHPYWQSRQFMGPDGIVVLAGEFGQEIHHYRADGVKEVVGEFRENGHDEVVRLFVEAVTQDGEVPVTATDAVEALRISLAALRSIESGGREAL